MATPTMDRFLNEITQILKVKDGNKLQQYLVLEPPYPQPYQVMVQELQRSFPASKQLELIVKLEVTLPEFEGQNVGGSWASFRMFLSAYLAFIRDVNVNDLIKTHESIQSVLSLGVSALDNSSVGIVILPTVIFYSQTLARLAIGLEKHPELMLSTRKQSVAGSGEDTKRITLVESSANIIREGFKKCIAERLAAANGGLDQYGKPAGRKAGIYVLANLCMKLFIRAQRFRSAEQVFTNIQQLSPPLSRYPAAQRVTYLYYLGRYHFANTHFLRAKEALQAAYHQSPRQCVKQRSQILIYLISANIIVGRFPSQQLFQRPEGAPLTQYFVPLCQAIACGNLASFRTFVELDSIQDKSSTAAFFLRHNILLHLRSRCEVLLCRSLARRVFILDGFHGSAESKTAPNLDLGTLRSVILALEKRIRPVNGVGASEPRYVDSDFDGVEDSEEDGGANGDEGENPTLEEVEAATASMVQQGLLRGFISHKLAKFVIMGAKGKNPVKVGFPRVWEVLKRGTQNQEIPGWVTDASRGAANRGGTVIRLSNVKPIGVAG